MRHEQLEEADAVLDEADDDHHQDDQAGQREGHRDLAGDGEAAGHHAEEIAEQHEDEEREDEGEEFQPVFAGRRMDHVGDEFVGQLGHRLAARRHQPAGLTAKVRNRRRAPRPRSPSAATGW